MIFPGRGTGAQILRVLERDDLAVLLPLLDRLLVRAQRGLDRQSHERPDRALEVPPLAGRARWQPPAPPGAVERGGQVEGSPCRRR